MIRKRPAKVAPNPYLTSASPDDLGPANRIAYDIVHDRRDVLPSVERIMNAGLDADALLKAMTLFQNALATTGDPHHDPRVAIADSGGAPDR